MVKYSQNRAVGIITLLFICVCTYFLGSDTSTNPEVSYFLFVMIIYNLVGFLTILLATSLYQLLGYKALRFDLFFKNHPIQKEVEKKAISEGKDFYVLGKEQFKILDEWRDKLLVGT